MFFPQIFILSSLLGVIKLSENAIIYYPGLVNQQSYHEFYEKTGKKSSQINLHALFSKLPSLLSSPQIRLHVRTHTRQVVWWKLLLAADERKPLTLLICVCYIRLSA